MGRQSVPQHLGTSRSNKTEKHRKIPKNRKKVYGTSIGERPEIVDSRTEAGHWEGDTVVGKRNGKESVILTLLEKKTENYIAIRIPGKTSEAVNAAMERLHEEFGEKSSQVFNTELQLKSLNKILIA